MNSRAPFMLSNSLALVSSKFGWILSGPRSYTTASNVTTVNYLNTFTQHTPIEENLRCFWDLETIGITANQVREMSKHNRKILQNFHDSFEIADDRRIVSLPWKPIISPLSDNKSVAEKRFYTLQKRLASNDYLKTQYEKCMLDYIKQGHVEMCPLEEGTENIVYYLPHHAVKKKRQNDVKWRIVFDASSHAPGKPSLNDTLEVGPNLLPESVGCLLRFRVHEYAITGDGNQAFLQLDCWWERLIGSVKRCLRKSLGRALLTEEQLSTVLIGVEAALNSRPLTNDDSSDSLDSALTPSHFLIGQKLTLIPSNPEGEKRGLTRVFRQQQDLLKIFWNKWSREYLLQLRSFHEVKNARKTAKIARGDLVLLNEEVRPRHMWKRGRILNIIEGRDGKPRACTIRVESGTQITRPLQLVIPLEIDQGGEDVEK